MSDALEGITDELAQQHPELSKDQVAALVNTAATGFEGARITEFIPVLICQQVNAHLRRAS